MNEDSKILYRFSSQSGGEIIETTLTRDGEGRLDLFCRFVNGEETETVLLPDLGRREERCLAFARTVAESHTRPRMLRELWEEYEA